VLDAGDKSVIEFGSLVTLSVDESYYKSKGMSLNDLCKVSYKPTKFLILSTAGSRDQINLLKTQNYFSNFDLVKK